MIYKIKNGDRISSGSIEKNIIEVRLTNKFIKTISSSEKIPFNKEHYRIGNKLMLKDNCVVIGKGINYVKISGKYMIDNDPTSSMIKMNIKKNGGDLLESICNSPKRYSQLLAIPRVIPVQEGDTISLFVSGGEKDSCPPNSNVCLMVEAVE